MTNKIEWKNLNLKKEALEAEKRVRNYIRETPVEYSHYLSQLGGCKLFLKLENVQVTGSFKIRGAANLMLSLSREEAEKGIVTASTGNHGAAIAYLSEKLGFKGTIYLPENVSESKIEALRLYGADLIFYGRDPVETERFAQEIAQKSTQVFVPPYNHPKIIGGQATVGIELRKQLQRIDAVFVPIGGGGLASGIAGYLKSVDKTIQIIGCQPVNSPVMFKSIKVGKIIEIESKATLSDGTAGGIEKNSITFDICKNYVDDYSLVSEDEIEDAIKLMLEKHYMLIEGAAALSVAAFIKLRERFENKNVALIISGKKISLKILKKILYKK